jgi:hypothetical protein
MTHKSKSLTPRIIIKENSLPKIPSKLSKYHHNYHNQQTTPRKDSPPPASLLLPPLPARLLLRESVRKEHGVIVVGPNGELIKIGETIFDDLSLMESSRASHKENDELVYRLFDEIPPYLYFTNKLDESVNLTYGNPNSESPPQDGNFWVALKFN